MKCMFLAKRARPDILEEASQINELPEEYNRNGVMS